MFLIAALPPLIADAGLGTAGRIAFGILRWPILGAVMIAGDRAALPLLAEGQPTGSATGFSPPARSWPRSAGCSCPRCSPSTPRISRATAEPTGHSRANRRPAALALAEFPARCSSARKSTVSSARRRISRQRPSEHRTDGAISRSRSTQLATRSRVPGCAPYGWAGGPMLEGGASGWSTAGPEPRLRFMV